MILHNIYKEIGRMAWACMAFTVSKVPADLDARVIHSIEEEKAGMSFLGDVLET